MTSSPQWIEADWPAPANIRAVTTLRGGGVSCDAFASLNLGAHVGDDPAAVVENRRRLREVLRLPAEPVWLNQVHGVTIVAARSYDTAPTADACVSDGAGQVCAVLTADCLPVLLCDRGGRHVAAAHAGWRGLVNGVLQAAVSAMHTKPSDLIAWLGPAIEQDAFEVGEEVRERFVSRDAQHAAAFARNARGRWQADLFALARRELELAGVRDVYGGGFRVYADSEKFFSYRRQSTTGRMATLIWRTE